MTQTELSIATVDKDNDGTFVVTLNGLPGWTFYQYTIPARRALPLIAPPAEPAKVCTNASNEGTGAFTLGCEKWSEAIDFARDNSIDAA